MDTVTLPLIVGGLFIILGFAAKRYPQLIAGYMKVKSLGKNEKKIIPSLFKHASVGTGLVILIGASLCKYWGFNIAYFLFLFTPPFTMVVWLQIKLGKLDERLKRRSLWVASFFSLIYFVCIIFFFINYKSADVIVMDDKIEITGAYGQDILLKDIETISMIDTMPTIRYRNGGFSLGKVKKGNFMLEGEDNVKLYLHSKDGPFIKIHTVDGTNIYLNYDDLEKLEGCYQAMTKNLSK